MKDSTKLMWIGFPISMFGVLSLGYALTLNFDWFFIVNTLGTIILGIFFLALSLIEHQNEEAEKEFWVGDKGINECLESGE